MAVCVFPGGMVMFTNSDTMTHDIEPVSGCPELALGEIAPTASKTATVANVAETCVFHDASGPGDSAFQATVAVSQTTTTGPGY
jgi:hypothetical protein